MFRGDEVKNANEEFTSLLQIIATNYQQVLKQKALTVEQIDLFKFMAKQHGLTKFYNAMVKHMSSPDDGMFFPTMAHINKHISGTTKQASDEIEFKAQGQWQMSVMRAIAECGSYRTPNFKDPITSACIYAAGGWIKLCGSTAEQLVWHGKEFVKNYENYSTRPLDQLPDKIAGRENIQKLKLESSQGMKSIMDGIDKLNKPKDDDCEGEPA